MKVPKLTTQDVKRALDREVERMNAHRKDEADRRCLRGKHAPPSGTCRVCGGNVVGIVHFEHTGRIGGPPALAYVAHWSCEGCGVMYDRVPPKKLSPTRKDGNE